MKETTRSRILAALAADYGRAADDAHRARAAFRGCDKSAQHGQSGRTVGELLSMYERCESEARDALMDFDPTWTWRRPFMKGE